MRWEKSSEREKRGEYRRSSERKTTIATGERRQQQVWEIESIEWEEIVVRDRLRLWVWEIDWEVKRPRPPSDGQGKTPFSFLSDLTIREKLERSAPFVHLSPLRFSSPPAPILHLVQWASPGVTQGAMGSPRLGALLTTTLSSSGLIKRKSLYRFPNSSCGENIHPSKVSKARWRIFKHCLKQNTGKTTSSLFVIFSLLLVACPRRFP